MSWLEFFPHARIIIDPTKLAELNLEIEKGQQPDKVPTRRRGLCRTM
jgi:hypothetical protein